MNPESLQLWLDQYHRYRTMFIREAITQFEAMQALSMLRFRGEALRIEMEEWEKGRKRRKYQMMRLALIRLERERARGITETSSE